MSMYDQSYNDGYPEQVASSVFESPSYTEAIDLGPAMPLSSDKGGFKPAPHGVLLIFGVAILALFLLGFFFHTHNLG